MSIASNAASALGMMEHPVTHQREVDVELGKHWIDVLGMLQKKTEGNLTRRRSECSKVCWPICGCNTCRCQLAAARRARVCYVEAISPGGDEAHLFRYGNLHRSAVNRL